ncbi:hypothetical protein [Bacillus mycoides]|uniref:hypothetical protein n=1 Tax=Bacillus mycoides TaxID=1405 RepID=UPI001C021DB7|nr:hypothetical protein [Bacillus mycoides]QWH79782.1 hypothetical protein EXW59_24995 [Bacillus mycoides]QWI44873.1 hypothetical protein EXW55_18495 [Bacillus mycoides]
MDKAKLIQKKIEEGKLSVNEARLILDLEPIEDLMKAICERRTNDILENCKQTNVVKRENEPLLQIVQSDIDAVPVVLYKGERIKVKSRVSFDWETDGHHRKPGTYIYIEHVEDSEKRINTKIIQHNHPIVEEVQLMYLGKE